MSAPRVRLSIDSLVLRGFAPSQRDSIVAEISAEIVRGLSEPGAAAALGDARTVDSLHAPASAATSSPGAAAGRAIVQALQK